MSSNAGPVEALATEIVSRDGFNRQVAPALRTPAILKRGQILGFGALVLTLATIVTLAAIGRPWVAGIVATTGLAAIVAIFVTGQYQPAPVHILTSRRASLLGYLKKSWLAAPPPDAANPVVEVRADPSIPAWVFLDRTVKQRRSSAAEHAVNARA